MPGWMKRLFGSQEDAEAVQQPATPEPGATHPNQPNHPAQPIHGNLAAKTSADRRSCARVNLDLQVRLRFETAEAMVASRTFDLSRSGAFISIRDPRPKGTKVRLTLEVEGSEIVVGGVVVRSCDGKKTSRRGMGIQFTEVTPAAAEALGRLLAPSGG